MAKYDLPVTIDYILHVSEASQIYYAAHSQGEFTRFNYFDMKLVWMIFEISLQ